MRVSSKDLLFTLTKLLIAALAIVYIVFFIHFEEIWKSFRQSRFIYIALAFLLVFLNIGLQSYKWRYLLRLIKPNVTLGEVLGSLLVGFTAGIFTPARIGEYGGRMFYVRDCNRLQTAGLTFIDKAFGFFVTVTMGLLGLLLFLKLVFDFPRIILFPEFSLAFVFVALMIYLFISPDVIKRVIKALDFKSKISQALKAMLASIDSFHRREAIVILGVSFLHYSVFFFQFHLLTLAFEPVPLWVGFVSITSTMFAKTVIPSITFGELGIRESAAIMFYNQFGFNGATAFNASILLFAINVLLPSAVGLFFIPRLAFSSKNDQSNPKFDS